MTLVWSFGLFYAFLRGTVFLGVVDHGYVFVAMSVYGTELDAHIVME
jgi:hypothetical protein